MRYTPFLKTLKHLLDDGLVGDVMSIEHMECVGNAHFSHSFTRGNWSKTENSSFMLLQKCCHDLDALQWLLDKDCKRIQSFGSRSYFIPKNAPEGSTEYCYNCPKKDECVFNAMDFELNKDYCKGYTWAGLNKPIPEITREEKIEFLKKDTYGKCVYKTDMDIVDRQCVSVEYENGSIATLNMVGGATIAGRHIHVIGEMGEIVGYIEENKFIVRKFFACDSESQLKERQEVYDLDKLYVLEAKDQSVTGHYGGDFFIMKDLLKLLRGEENSLSTTDINDSVKGHLVCYAAELARKEKRVVDLTDFSR
jgi:hypothetical protein